MKQREKALEQAAIEGKSQESSKSNSSQAEMKHREAEESKQLSS
jgi:hypothetical protein